MNIDCTKKYALAVSGGIDSMVMLHKFAELNPRPEFFAVTVNHKIREEAEKDCLFVKEYCETLGVECRVFAVDVPAYAKQRKLSTETAARCLRYGVLDKLDCDFVCLAHQSDDNAETVLMHIIRGSGAYGAEGIRRINGRYLRPILDLTREEVREYAEKNKVPYVTDATNSDDKYARNFIRLGVMPLLKKLQPSVTENICRFAGNIAEDNAFLDSLADVSEVEFSGESARIPKKLFLRPRPLVFRIIRKVLRMMDVYCDVEKTHIDALISLADNNGGKMLSLPFDLYAVNDYNYITLFKADQAAPQEFSLPFKKGVTRTPLGEAAVTREKTKDSLYFDINRIPPDAVFRTRRQGDVFTKFGGGTKPLGRYLIDKKVPSRLRDRLLLVASGSRILIVCGVEISEDVAVKENSDTYYIKLT